MNVYFFISVRFPSVSKCECHVQFLIIIKGTRYRYTVLYFA